MELLGSSRRAGQVPDLIPLASDFDCDGGEYRRGRRAKAAGRSRAALHAAPDRPRARRRRAWPSGADVRIRVTLADSSGGGSFVVHLRGDVAPIMAARILGLARSRILQRLDVAPGRARFRGAGRGIGGQRVRGQSPVHARRAGDRPPRPGHGGYEHPGARHRATPSGSSTFEKIAGSTETIQCSPRSSRGSTSSTAFSRAT